MDGGDVDDCSVEAGVQVNVKVISVDVDVEGECVELTGVGGDRYVGSVPISSRYDVPGTVFIQSRGTDNPVVTVRFFDADDGLGNVCGNDLALAGRGLVEVSTGADRRQGAGPRNPRSAR